MVRTFREPKHGRPSEEISAIHINCCRNLRLRDLHWVATKKPIVRLPASEHPERLFKTFPGLQKLRAHVTLTTQASYDASVLTYTEAARPDEAQILTILETVQGSPDANSRRWIHNLLPASDSYDILGREPAWAEVARRLPLFKVTDALSGIQKVNAEYWSVNRVLDEDAVFVNDADSHARLAAARCASSLAAQVLRPFTSMDQSIDQIAES